MPVRDRRADVERTIEHHAADNGCPNPEYFRQALMAAIENLGITWSVYVPDPTDDWRTPPPRPHPERVREAVATMRAAIRTTREEAP